MHKGERRAPTTKVLRETEAEAVAFVVCSALGLETNNAAVDYIQVYSGDANLLMESLSLVQQTGTGILAAILDNPSANTKKRLRQQAKLLRPKHMQYRINQENKMKIIHQLSDDGSVSKRAIRVLLIGSGGNGSTVLFGLPYLHHALVAWGKADGLDVRVMDADIVSPTNCVRQPFGAADIGQNKATTLVNRVNMFHGFHWKSQEEFFSKTKASSLTSYDRTIDLARRLQ